MWPVPSPVTAFAERRRKLQRKLVRSALIASGQAPARNFPANQYPFRASSHFLYFVGRQLPGAVLLMGPGRTALYAPPPDPDQTLWMAQESLGEIEQALELEVRPLDDLPREPEAAAMPPQDAYTASRLSEKLGRPITAGAGSMLKNDRDRELADAVIELRLRHDDAAIDQMRQAAAVSELAHRAGLIGTRPGLREAQVRAAMISPIFECGMTSAYEPIVTVHGEVLHNQRYENVVDDGDLLLADVGAETPEGWASDVTRTWPVSGRFTRGQRELYQAVLEAQRVAIDAVAPGVRYRDIHRMAARRLLDGLVQMGLLRGDPDQLLAQGAAALFFPHGVGHLIGLDVHDMEDLGDRAGYAPGRERSSAPGERWLRLDRDLEPGMAVTIEPGFYQIEALLRDGSLGPLETALDRRRLQALDVRGIRIEDDVLVTESGREVLTAKIPKLPDAVEAAMQGL